MMPAKLPYHNLICRLSVSVLAVFLISIPLVPAIASSSLDDTAKVLAGLPPSAGSSLEPLTEAAGYKIQAAKFAQMWRQFEERQLSRVRSWAEKELASVRPEAPVLYYTFSGPDIVYANSFFPDCRTYVLCGLEPVGRIPDLSALGPQKIGGSLGRLYDSLKTVLALSFFKTKDMGSDFRNTQLPGTTPVLLTFLARLGKTVRSAELVSVDQDGNVRPRDADSAAPDGGDTPGVRITFDAGPDTPEQTVYYFTADISDQGLAKNPGFANFCRQLEPGAGLVKAASYLMHTGAFAATRDFLMERCRFILQDDTGIPAVVFTDRQWNVRPYGRYARPIDMFRGFYQKKLKDIFAQSDRTPLGFGIGYYRSLADCNVILATRGEAAVQVAAAPASPVQPAPSPQPETATVVASNENPPGQTLIQLEAEELRIRNDTSLTKKERLQKLREIWKQQLAVMGKSSA